MGLLRVSLYVVLGAVLWQVAVVYFRPSLQPTVGGSCHPHFKEVADLFKQNVESGFEPGASFAVFHKGELLCDLWGGFADAGAEQPWRKDTVSIAFSTSKGVAAIVAAKMVERGWLDYSKPVMHYWPEFGKNGKEKMTVEMLLSHQGGLPYIDTPVSLYEIRNDPKKVEDILAAQAPIWTPGTAHGYHSVTFGLYVDTLVKKADPKKRNMSQIFIEEIGKPFDIEFFFGVPRELSYRAARMTFAGLLEFITALFKSPLTQQIFIWNRFSDDGRFQKSSNAVTDLAKINSLNDPEKKSVGVSSFLGFSNARQIAKLYGILADGGSHKGKSLLSASTIKKLGTKLVEGDDQLLHFPSIKGPGTMIFKNPKNQEVFGHPGYGGQVGFADVHAKLGMSYITNFISMYGMGDDPRYQVLEEAFYKKFETFPGK